MKQINKKAEFRIDWLLLSAAIFALVFMTSVAMINDIDNEYGDIANISDSEFSTINTKVSEQYSIAERAKNLTLDADVTDTDTLEGMTRGSYSGIRTSAKDSFKLVGNLTNTVAMKLGLPGYFISIFGVVLTLLITFSLVYLLRGFIPK